jgi:hypothetical protein
MWQTTGMGQANDTRQPCRPSRSRQTWTVVSILLTLFNLAGK